MADSGLVPYSGKNCRVEVNGQILKNGFWDVDPSGDPQDTYNFESNGFDESTAGRKRCRIKFGGVWDSTVNHGSAPPIIRPMGFITSVRLYLDKNTNFFWNFDKALVLGVPTKVAAGENVSYEVDAQSVGDYQMPGNITP